jgi:hypothetical protein
MHYLHFCILHCRRSSFVEDKNPLLWSKSHCTFHCTEPGIILQCKVKVKLSLCFNWAPRHEGVLGEWRYSYLNSALDGSEWSASRPRPLSPQGKAPGTHWIGSWVGLRAGLEAVVKRKIPSHCRDSNVRSSRPYFSKYSTRRKCLQQMYCLMNDTDVCYVGLKIVKMKLFSVKIY